MCCLHILRGWMDLLHVSTNSFIFLVCDKIVFSWHGNSCLGLNLWGIVWHVYILVLKKLLKCCRQQLYERNAWKPQLDIESQMKAVEKDMRTCWSGKGSSIYALWYTAVSTVRISESAWLNYPFTNAMRRRFRLEILKVLYTALLGNFGRFLKINFQSWAFLPLDRVIEGPNEHDKLVLLNQNRFSGSFVWKNGSDS